MELQIQYIILKDEINIKRALRERKKFNLFILGEDIDDIIKIVKPLEKSRLLIDGANETVKNGIKKQEGEFLRTIMAPMAA